MGITNNQLLGKKVYASDGSYQGEVVETGFVLGSGEPLLVLKTDFADAVEVPWTRVVAAKDILIVAESLGAPGTRQEAVRQGSRATESIPGGTAEPKLPATGGGILRRLGRGKEAAVCPKCGRPANWIKEYGRWYCYRDKEYI